MHALSKKPVYWERTANIILGSGPRQRPLDAQELVPACDLVQQLYRCVNSTMRNASTFGLEEWAHAEWPYSAFRCCNSPGYLGILCACQQDAGPLPHQPKGHCAQLCCSRTFMPRPELQAGPKPAPAQGFRLPETRQCLRTCMMIREPAMTVTKPRPRRERLGVSRPAPLRFPTRAPTHTRVFKAQVFANSGMRCNGSEFHLYLG